MRILCTIRGTFRPVDIKDIVIELIKLGYAVSTEETEEGKWKISALKQ